MSYAIIRNSNYKKENLAGLYKHNERKNTNYSNKNIDRSKSINNYSIKSCNTTYYKAIQDLIKKYDMKNRITSYTNLLCEFVITSDKDFFEKIGQEETKRYFQTAYKFVANYKNLGEDFILSAKIHNDEATPHMHLTFVPVIHKIDKKSGKEITKIACSEYWKGKESYKILQDSFYNYMTRAGFKLERGLEGNKHIETEKLKKMTEYEVSKYENNANIEQEREITDTEELKKEYKRIIRKFNTLAKHYTRIKTYTDKAEEQSRDIELQNYSVKAENERLKKENKRLNNYIEKSIKWISIVLNMPFERITRLINNFIEREKSNNDRNKSSRE